MRFSIKREITDGEDALRYQLFDNTGILVMVAERRLATAGSGRRQVRFARPDGRLVARLDLPRRSPDLYPHRRGLRENFAVIINHAVYAVVSTYDPLTFLREVEAEGVAVEGERVFLLGPEPEATELTYEIYQYLPHTLVLESVLKELEVPEAVGYVRREVAGNDYTVELAPGLFRQLALMALALVFVVERDQGRSQPETAAPPAQ